MTPQRRRTHHHRSMNFSHPRAGPGVATGNLSHGPLQDIAGGIDVAIMVSPASGAIPFSLLQPALAALLPLSQAALLLAQIPQMRLQALGVRDLLSRRKGREVLQSQGQPHGVVHDG